MRGSVKASSVKEIPQRIGRGKVYSDPPLSRLLTCGKSHKVGDASDVQDDFHLRTQKLWDQDLDGSRVAVAIVDTGIYLRRLSHPLGVLTGIPNPSHAPQYSWTPPNVVTSAFHHRLGHGTMCAHDVLITAPKATLLDVAMLLFRPLGDHTVPTTVFAAMAAYSHLANLWNAWLTLGASKPYDALVISNSWGIFHPFLDPFPPGDSRRFIDNPTHVFRTTFTQILTQKGMDIVFASNNCGPDCPSGTCLSKTDEMIMGANAYEEVLTVGGCDINYERVGYSSLGPSIPGLYDQKPDLAAYTHFLGSKTRRIWVPDTGVSAACAVAAGCVAALRSGLPTTPPRDLFNALKANVRTGIGGGTAGGTWNKYFGYGIIDPVAAGVSLGLSIP